jgi:hypothetical protein
MQYGSGSGKLNSKLPTRDTEQRVTNSANEKPPSHESARSGGDAIHRSLVFRDGTLGKNYGQPWGYTSAAIEALFRQFLRNPIAFSTVAHCVQKDFARVEMNRPNDVAGFADAELYPTHRSFRN